MFLSDKAQIWLSREKKCQAKLLGDSSTRPVGPRVRMGFRVSRLECNRITENRWNCFMSTTSSMDGWKLSCRNTWKCLIKLSDTRYLLHHGVDQDARVAKVELRESHCIEHVSVIRHGLCLGINGLACRDVDKPWPFIPAALWWLLSPVGVAHSTGFIPNPSTHTTASIQYSIRRRRLH